VVSVVLGVVFTRKWWIARGEQRETLRLAVVLQAAAEDVRGSDAAPDPSSPSYATRTSAWCKVPP